MKIHDKKGLWIVVDNSVAPVCVSCVALFNAGSVDKCMIHKKGDEE